MNSGSIQTCLVLWLLANPVIAQSVIDERLEFYRQQGAQSADPLNGVNLWTMRQGDRSCGSCHGEDLRVEGRHVKTGKDIEAMAPSVNADRYTRRGKIEKWFKRNCKWTYGRECTVQEKADILTWLAQQ